MAGHGGRIGLPVSTPSRVDAIEDRLITAVAVGEYLPGARLPTERELAATLGVGRMTVRSALARLVDRGVIQTLRGRGGGSFVVDQWPPSSTDAVRRTLEARWSDLNDTMEAICRLHGTVSRAAAENRDEADVARLEQSLADYRSAETGRPAQHADELLHLAIIDSAHSATLKSVLLDLEARVSIGAPAHLWGAPGNTAEMERRALHEHEQLVRAILEGHADNAEAIARAHVGIDLELLAGARERAGLG